MDFCGCPRILISESGSRTCNETSDHAAEFHFSIAGTGAYDHRHDLTRSAFFRGDDCLLDTFFFCSGKKILDVHVSPTARGSASAESSAPTAEATTATESPSAEAAAGAPAAVPSSPVSLHCPEPQNSLRLPRAPREKPRIMMSIPRPA